MLNDRSDQDPRFTDELTDALRTVTSAPPFAITVGDAWSVGAGRRRRRRGGIVAGSTAVTLVLAGVPAVVLHAGHASTPSRLQAATEPSAATVHDVAGEDSPYWFEQYQELFYGAGNKLAEPRAPRYDLWLGHDRPSVGSTGSGPNYPKPERYPAFGTVGFAAATRHAWTDQWTSATGPGTVRAYLQGVGPEDAVSGKIASTTDSRLFDAGNDALEFPGPTDFRSAVIGFMKQLPEVTVSTGTDEAGRAATMLSFHEPTSNVTTVSYVDSSTATLLETDAVSAAVPQHAITTLPGLSDGSTRTTVPAQEASRIMQIWYASRPADTAPGGATTAEQQAAAESIPANPDPSHPTCTPGKPVDATPLAAQMAAICLPDPAPGFPFRRGLDYAGSKDDRSFYVSRLQETTTHFAGGGTSTSGGGATATIQIQPDNTFSLTGAKSVTPDSSGRVGDCKAVGSATVLGAPATECVPVENGHEAAGQIGLIASVDGLGVEVFADGGTTFQQLITLANSLHIAPQPTS